MAKLDNYSAFMGHHWESGSIANALAYQGVVAPHTKQSISEALLMGISGGVVMGYFSFAYEGHPPHVALLTRNTFDPMNTMLERLGIVQNLYHTSKSAKAVQNLIEVIESGVVPIVWADVYSMPYNFMQQEDDMWHMYPIVVFDYDEVSNAVKIADRAKVPLTVTTDQLAKARSVVKKDKYRVLTLDPPIMDKLPAAVTAGIWDCIKLFTEKPPKGSRDNFGLSGFQRWSKVLTNPKAKQSWERVFPAGEKMYDGLTTAFGGIEIFGRYNDSAERGMFADFLDEASMILNQSALKDVADLFRDSQAAWGDLAYALLPDEIEPFGEIRKHILRQQQLFIEQGDSVLDELAALHQQSEGMRHQMMTDFPLDTNGVTAMREGLSEHILRIHDIEAEAISALKDAML